MEWKGVKVWNDCFNCGTSFHPFFKGGSSGMCSKKCGIDSALKKDDSTFKKGWTRWNTLKKKVKLLLFSLKDGAIVSPLKCEMDFTFPLLKKVDHFTKEMIVPSFLKVIFFEVIDNKEYKNPNYFIFFFSLRLWKNIVYFTNKKYFLFLSELTSNGYWLIS